MCCPTYFVFIPSRVSTFSFEGDGRELHGPLNGRTFFYRPGRQALVESDKGGKILLAVLSCLLLCITLTGPRRSRAPFLCVSERNRPTPVRRRLSLTHAGLGKLNSGGVGITSVINIWSLEAFSCDYMLHLYSAHRVTLVHD